MARQSHQLEIGIRYIRNCLSSDNRMMATHSSRIRQATSEDLDLLVPLFDDYRQFYLLPSDPERARSFLSERLRHNQSVVFLAFDNGGATGFTQLYPSFSSGAMERTFILNDLFVAPQARRRGTGAALLEAATKHARTAGAHWLVLSTELTNIAARAPYEKLGWKRDTSFCVYQFAL